MESSLEFVLPKLEHWGYWVVFIMTFLETSAFVGLVVPGEVTLLVAGLLAAQGILYLPALIVVAAIGAILGDNVGYTIGRYGGVKFLNRYGRYFFFKEQYLKATEQYFLRHGGKTILFGRFVGFLRSFAPLVAGISRMPYRSFLFYDILGGVFSVTIILLLGYFFGQSWQLINKWLGWSGLIVFGMLLASIFSYWLYKKHRRR